MFSATYYDLINQLKYTPNIAYLLLFIFMFIYFTTMLFKTKYFWFNLRLFIGYLLKVMLFLVQVRSLGSYE